MVDLLLQFPYDVNKKVPISVRLRAGTSLLLAFVKVSDFFYIFVTYTLL